MSARSVKRQNLLFTPPVPMSYETRFLTQQFRHYLGCATISQLRMISEVYGIETASELLDGYYTPYAVHVLCFVVGLPFDSRVDMFYNQVDTMRQRAVEVTGQQFPHLDKYNEKIRTVPYEVLRHA